MVAINPDRGTGFSDPVIMDLHSRVTNLEKNENHQYTEIALLKKDLSYIKIGQDKMNTGLIKLFWLVASGIVAAIVAFVLEGGLNLP